MKKILTPKNIVFVFIMIIISFLILEIQIKPLFVLIGVILSIWIAITLHELGHICMGLLNGFKFIYFITGPFEFYSNKKIYIRENKNWLFFFGVSLLISKDKNMNTLRNKWLLFSAGGPLMSFFIALIMYTLYEMTGISFILVFSIINATIALVTLIPTNMMLKSDGYIIKGLLLNNEKSYQLLEHLIIINETLSPVSPKFWDKTVIDIAKKQQANIDNISSSIVIFYHYFCLKGFKYAYDSILRFTEIPITNKNKYILSFIIGVIQLNNFFTKKDSIEEIINLQKYLSNIEPITFLRGEAMITYLTGDKNSSKLYIKKIYVLLDKSPEYLGFYKAERKLTKLLEKYIEIY